MRENEPSQALSRQLPRRGSFWPSVGQLRDNGEDLASFPLRFPPVKKQLWKIRRFSRVANKKIFFPLFMRKANAERIPNRFFLQLTHKAPEGVSPGGFAML